MSAPLWQRALAPLQLPYAAALAVKNLAYRQGWLPRHTLGWPVVSIGNLSVGGAGKTPVVIALAKLLTAHGLAVDVLSRGYGRQAMEAVERVAPEGSARRFGDEPLLIAQTAGAPVYVGRSRFHAGLLAERGAAAPGVHLLDDGFQHRALARTVDLVVMHPGDPESLLLPVGRLREPLRALRRAAILVLRDDDTTTEPALAQARIHKPIWRVRRRLLLPQLGGHAVAFCGIAHPQEFFRGLRNRGIMLRAAVAFRDHHRFQPHELRSLAARARGSAALLTTEKDLLRLSAAQREELSVAAPLHAVPLVTEFVQPGRCVWELLALLPGQGSMRE